MTSKRKSKSSDDDSLSEVDRRALERALKLDSAYWRRRNAQDIASGRSSWLEAALGSAYHCQVRELKLRLWQTPPCWVDDSELEQLLHAPDDYKGERRAATIVWRLRSFNRSKFEPTPLRAFEEAEAARKTSK